MSEFRGFIAVDIDTNSKIEKILIELEGSGAFIKLVELKNIHITIKFLGSIDFCNTEEISDIIKNATNNIQPFKIELAGMGVFPNQNYIKVIWIGIKQGESIEIIARKIDEQFSKIGFKKEKRDFSPHFTIARVRSFKGKDEILQVIKKYRDVQFVDLRVDSIKLKKSDLTPEGPIYTTMIEVKL